VPTQRTLAKPLLVAALVATAALPAAASARRNEEGPGTERPTGEHRARAGKGDVRCALTLTTSEPHVVEGEGVMAQGKLVCPPEGDASERVVTVYRTGGGLGKTAVGSATTEADGSFELAVADLETNSILSARSDHASGARAAVKVAPKIVLDGPPTSTPLALAVGRARVRPTFTGSVGAAYAGAAVALQTTYDASGDQWRPVAFGRVDAQGDYTLAHGFKAAGEAWVRVVVHARHGKAPAASEPLSYQVVAAQNPDLTILSSAPQVAFGQTVTIEGAASATNQPLALLARHTGSPMQVVATTTSDEAGHYAFTQTPQQNTYYEVRDASAKSTPLFVGVRNLLEAPAPPSTVEAGQQVQLERQNASGIGFHAIATTTLNGSDFSIARAFEGPGTYTLRLKVPGSAGVQAAASAPFTLQVTAAATTLLGSPEPAPPLGGSEEPEESSSQRRS
jgi:hypothetical protein